MKLTVDSFRGRDKLDREFSNKSILKKSFFCAFSHQFEVTVRFDNLFFKIRK
jgi:hypothetical protein